MKKVIDYNLLVEELKRDVIKKSLKYIQNDQLPGAHHFFIAFATNRPGVAMSKRLLEKYPNEMTVVLQHQFKDFEVKDSYFSVKLYFDGIEEQLDIPYNAIVSFADPSEKFGLHFKNIKNKSQIKKDAAQPIKQAYDNIIMLDQFRNK